MLEFQVDGIIIHRTLCMETPPTGCLCVMPSSTRGLCEEMKLAEEFKSHKRPRIPRGIYEISGWASLRSCKSPRACEPFLLFRASSCVGTRPVRRVCCAEKSCRNSISQNLTCASMTLRALMTAKVAEALFASICIRLSLLTQRITTRAAERHVTSQQEIIESNFTDLDR